MGTRPAVWAASTQSFAPYWWHRAASRATGSLIPNTLEAPVHTTSLVRGPMAWRNCSRVASLSPGTVLAAVQVTPRWAASADKGRITALCSRSETTAWSPFCSWEESTRFNAWVQLGWKLTCSGPRAPSRAAAFFRHWYTSQAAWALAG